MIYARVFDGNGASGFRLGGEDALCVLVREPPPDARYFLLRAVRVQAGRARGVGAGGTLDQ